MGKAPRSVVDNIDQVVRLEEALTASRTFGERLGNAVGSFAGRMLFVLIQAALVSGWIVVNLGLPGVPAFDPYPYPMGGVLLSLEGVLLASFVLMKQAHAEQLSERRSHLNLQANLLVEKEVTKLIQMMQRQSVVDGTEDRVVDQETAELSGETAVDSLSEELDKRLSSDRN